MTDPAEKPAIPRLKVTWHSLLYLLLLGGGILGALYLHQVWQQQADRAKAPAPLLPAGTWEDSVPAVPPSANAPVDQRIRSFLPEGMTQLTGEPMDLSPPAGFTRQSAFSRTMGGLRYEVASYRGEGDMETLLRHYRGLLGGRGFATVGDQTARDGARTVTSTKEETKIILRLHKNRRQENIIEVLVTAIRPAGNKSR